MYGEDASGRKVSLLNDTSTSHPTAPPRRPLFIRPTLPHRSKDASSISLPSSRPSQEGSHKSSSSRSSISCSPRHSPPTPPLVRLDSRSSIHTLKTPSPMTPYYNFDPLDHNDFNKNQQGGLPYYTNGYRQQNGGEEGNPYPPMQNPNQHVYYTGMNAQQALPPMYSGVGHAYPPQASLQTQAPPLPQFPTTHPMNPLGPPTTHHGLPPISPLQSNQPPLLLTKSKIEPTSAPPPTSAVAQPMKTDPTPPMKTVNTSITTTPTPANKPRSSTPSGTTPTTASSSSLPKKKYPCPHAKEYKCIDTFTTSGHAARHGKKHTGEKNVNCPTCGKAFTRKDNMKQHERTHKPGHGSRAGGGSSAADSSPATTTTTTTGAVSSKVRKRTMSGSTMASLASSSSVTAMRRHQLDTSGVVLDDGEDDDDDDDDDVDDAEDEEDADGDVDMDVTPQPQRPRDSMTMTMTQQFTEQQRPTLGKSKLSEILEQVTSTASQADTDMDGDADADADADGEGESPGLDALATVAAGDIGGRGRIGR